MKQIFLTEEQASYILSKSLHPKHTITEEDKNNALILLSEAIREEYSINQNVSNMTWNFLDEINKKIKSEKKQEIESGVSKQMFTIRNNNEENKEIVVNVYNINFNSRKDYDEKYKKYERYINMAQTSDELRHNKFFITLHSASISGNLLKQIVSDNLQHEIEHCFQMSKVNKRLPSDVNYTKAYTILMSPVKNQLLYNISMALYYSYPFEQDGFVNGLYQYLYNQEKGIIDFEELKETSAYEALTNLRKLKELFKTEDKDNVERLLIQNFNMTFNRFLKILDFSEKRFIKKIGKILAKHRKDMLEKGSRLNEKFDNSVFYFF